METGNLLCSNPSLKGSGKDHPVPGGLKEEFLWSAFFNNYCSAAAGETSGTGDLIVNHGDTFTHYFNTCLPPPLACFSLDETC